MKIRIRILGIISFIVFSGCGNNDYNQELSGSYFYRNEGGNKQDILSHIEGRQEIYSKIIDYKYNRNFIVAKQIPNYYEYKEMVAFYLREDVSKYPTNSIEDIKKSEITADSILQKNPFYISIFRNKINYWIIVIGPRIVYGPLSYGEYLNKTSELKIPKDLLLQKN